jgi:hypothetical protein
LCDLLTQQVSHNELFDLAEAERLFTDKTLLIVREQAWPNLACQVDKETEWQAGEIVSEAK